MVCLPEVCAGQESPDQKGIAQDRSRDCAVALMRVYKFGTAPARDLVNLGWGGLFVSAATQGGASKPVSKIVAYYCVRSRSLDSISARVPHNSNGTYGHQTGLRSQLGNGRLLVRVQLGELNIKAKCGSATEEASRTAQFPGMVAKRVSRHTCSSQR